jgi:hypothetical protein
MSRKYLVMLPVGMGKTRIVWGQILRGCDNRKRLNPRINGTLICGPNRRLREVWLRELALFLFHKRRWLIDPEKYPFAGQDTALRSRGIGYIQRFLEWNGFKEPRYRTFSELARTRNSNSEWYRFLIFDEWHNIGNALREQCADAGGKRKRWYLRKNRITNGIFFVSATPINPVLAEDSDTWRDSNPADHATFKKRLSEGLQRAIKVLQAFSGRASGDLNNDLPFLKIVKKLGVELYPRSVTKREGKAFWALPKGFCTDRDHRILRALRKLGDNEITFLGGAIPQDDGPGSEINRTREYAFAAGLIQTRKSVRRGALWKYRIARPGKKRCFGRKYRTLYSPASKISDAARWLCEEHGRARRLLEILEFMKVVRKNGNGYSPTGKKALIFCIHQGVCNALTHALVHALGNGKAALWVRNTLGEDKQGGGALDKRFNEDGEPYILVTTDAYSESIDLHTRCNILLHYELPWSPLRLFQRIGRLTRIKENPHGYLEYNPDVRIGHVIMPGSVEEERVNRLYRRIEILRKQDLWPRDYRRNDRRYSVETLFRGLLGDGPSLHCEEVLRRSSA